MEAFFKTHKYLVEHTDAPVRRNLMDEIDWSDRLIGIKGTRGIGKTTFLLQYAKENFDTNNRRCLYVNMNNFYFRDVASLTLRWISITTVARFYSLIKCSSSKTGAASFASATTNVLT